MDITPGPPDDHHADWCGCERCEMIFHIVRYMLFWMEPTDRALRLPPERD